MVILANRSSFPEQIDSFVELFDLPPNLVASAKRYQELKIKPTLTANEQTELNNLSVQLGNYIITPETWNKMGDSIVNMEQFIKDEVDGYIQAKQQEWADYVKDFHYVGVHDTTLTYEFQNMVKASASDVSSHMVEGVSPIAEGDLFLALQDVPAGIDILDTTYWQKISVKGDKGDTGLNAYFKGDYNSTVAYALGDAVMFDGSIYYCILATTAGTDPSDSTHWKLWDKTYVGATAPTTVQRGLLWIEVLD